MAIAIIPIREHQANSLKLMRQYLTANNLQEKLSAAEELTTQAVRHGLNGAWAQLAVYGACAHEAGIITAREIINRVAELYVKKELASEVTQTMMDNVRRGRVNQNQKILTFGNKIPGITVGYFDKNGAEFSRETIGEQILQLIDTEPDLRAMFESSVSAFHEQVKAEREKEIQAGKRPPVSEPLQYAYKRPDIGWGIGCYQTRLHI